MENEFILDGDDMRLSLQELLLITVFAAVGLAGVAGGSPASGVAIAAFVVVLAALGVNAFVAGPSQRAFAVGYVVPAILYVALTFTVGPNEYSVSGGRLPTSQAIQAFERSKREPPPPDRAILIARDSAWSQLAAGHMLSAAAAGYIGACYARWISTRSRET